mmetsp:Transcript_79782/g.145621  ORF Transcript_79782/g.145621 Transcript_79782/m.145621 type:complete len:220 (-) Transcript_79782:319-978(-)
MLVLLQFQPQKRLSHQAQSLYVELTSAMRLACYPVLRHCRLQFHTSEPPSRRECLVARRRQQTFARSLARHTPHTSPLSMTSRSTSQTTPRWLTSFARASGCVPSDASSRAHRREQPQPHRGDSTSSHYLAEVIYRTSSTQSSWICCLILSPSSAHCCRAICQYRWYWFGCGMMHLQLWLLRCLCFHGPLGLYACLAIPLCCLILEGCSPVRNWQGFRL